MATTYTCATAQSSAPAYEHRLSGLPIRRYFSYTLTSAAELGTINNVIELVKVPAGARVMDFFIELPENDGATSFTWDLGDGSDTNRFVNANTTGQSAGFASSTAFVAKTSTTGLGYQYSAEDTIDLLVSAAPASAAATSGTLHGWIDYIME